MIQVISMLRSGTLHGLIVALIAYAIGVLGLTDNFPDAQGVLDAALKLLEVGGIVYAAIKRTFFPNPPLTQVAAAKEQNLLNQGKLEIRS